MLEIWYKRQERALHSNLQANHAIVANDHFHCPVAHLSFELGGTHSLTHTPLTPTDPHMQLFLIQELCATTLQQALQTSVLHNRETHCPDGVSAPAGGSERAMQ